jgi:hypothetical protein
MKIDLLDFEVIGYIQLNDGPSRAFKAIVDDSITGVIESDRDRPIPTRGR